MKHPLGIRVDTPLRVWLFVVLVTLFATLSSIVTVAIILWISGYDSTPIAYLIAGVVPLFVMPPITYILAQIAYELTCAQEELFRLARTDELTGLSNRRAFFERGHAMMQEARAQNHTVGLLLLDADNFKSINDSFGHLAGDEALRYLARTIRCCAAATDVVARFGGDEFAVLRHKAGSDEMGQLAAAIRTELAQQQPLYRANPLALTISVGVTDSTVASTFDTLLLSADIAFYNGKAQNSLLVAESRPVQFTSATTSIS
ncbi:MAG: GGDEF domain-containing protein [Caldilineaceae bacterium]